MIVTVVTCSVLAGQYGILTGAFSGYRTGVLESASFDCDFVGSSS